MKKRTNTSISAVETDHTERPTSPPMSTDAKIAPQLASGSKNQRQNRKNSAAKQRKSEPRSPSKNTRNEEGLWELTGRGTGGPRGQRRRMGPGEAHRGHQRGQRGAGAEQRLAMHQISRKPTHRHSLAFFLTIHGDRVEALTEFAGGIRGAPSAPPPPASRSLAGNVVTPPLPSSLFK